MGTNPMVRNRHVSRRTEKSESFLPKCFFLLVKLNSKLADLLRLRLLAWDFEILSHLRGGVITENKKSCHGRGTGGCVPGLKRLVAFDARARANSVGRCDYV